MKTKLLTAILLLQAAYLLYTAATNERRLAEGIPVLLETLPVDPRDLLRGDYVILRYKISDLPRHIFVPEIYEPLPPAQDIWVTLAPVGDFHEATAASLWPTPTQPGEVQLRGQTTTDIPHPSDAPVTVNYGIEQYYVREGTGNPQGKLTVELRVSQDNTPQIHTVYLDNVPYEQAMTQVAR